MQSTPKANETPYTSLLDSVDEAFDTSGHASGTVTWYGYKSHRTLRYKSPQQAHQHIEHVFTCVLLEQWNCHQVESKKISLLLEVSTDVYVGHSPVRRGIWCDWEGAHRSKRVRESLNGESTNKVSIVWSNDVTVVSIKTHAGLGPIVVRQAKSHVEECSADDKENAKSKPARRLDKNLIKITSIILAICRIWLYSFPELSHSKLSGHTLDVIQIKH